MSEIKNELALANEFLLKAEASMEREEYREVIVNATSGLEVMLEKANKFFFKRFSFDSKDRELQNLGSLLNETIICYSLNINMEEYVRYRKMVGYFRVIVNDQSIARGLFYDKNSVFENFEKKDAEISLAYCKKTITEIEETLKRLNKPLGEE
jgi:hypothetical protein